LQLEITNKITALVQSLNQWAMDRGRSVFGSVNFNTYLQNGWEYTTPGSLATITNAGPSGADQLKIPEAIRQARFNLYMVAYGQSLGIHNPTYTRYLLQDASDKVASTYPLPTAPKAEFTGSPTKITKGKTVKFTNFSDPGLTSFSWDFGNGTTSTAENPTATYATAGTNTVILTASPAGANSQRTRTAYIIVEEPPVSAFSATPTTGSAPLKVTFSNTSTGATGYNWTFGNGWSSTNASPVYTYTNAGVYTVRLTTSSSAGTNAAPATATITVTP
jgi:PKD repeat protein